MLATPFSYPKIETPAESLVVCDLSHDRMDGQIAACTLQGIVNRQSTEKIYVTNTYCFDNKRGGATQAQVAERLLKELFADIPAQRIAGDDRSWPGALALIDRFINYLKGLVIWDPRLEDATIEAGTTIAGQTDSLLISPEMAGVLADRGLPIIEDLRDHNFGSNLQCLEWLKENWFDGANKKVAFTWSHMSTNGRSWGAANKDFVTAHKLFTFYLDIRSETEREHYIDVLKDYPPGTPVMGWTDERWADELFGRLGYFMVPYISVENLTVQSSFPSTTGSQPEPQPLEIDNNAVYLAFYIADGDNLEHSLVYEPDTIMTSEDFATIPTTWIINPGIVDLAPRLFDWFMKKPTDQEWGAMLGDGHPLSDRYAGFKFYCDLGQAYLKKSGIRTLKQMGEAEAVAWNIRPYMINSGYAGTDFRGIGPYDYHMDGETFHIGSTDTLDGIEKIRTIVQNAPEGKPLFLNVFTGTASFDTPAAIKKAAEELKQTEQEDGRTYHFVRSMDLAATYRRWVGTAK